MGKCELQWLVSYDDIEEEERKVIRATIVSMLKVTKSPEGNLRAAIHDTTAVTNDKTGERQIVKDEKGDHFTVELKRNKKAGWFCYHYYLVKENGVWVPNTTLIENPERFEHRSRTGVPFDKAKGHYQETVDY